MSDEILSRAESVIADLEKELAWNDGVAEDAIALIRELTALRSPGGDGELVAALRDMPCIRPCNGRPDDFTVGQCCDAGECGCGNAAALSAAEATSAPHIGGDWSKDPTWWKDKIVVTFHGNGFGASATMKQESDRNCLFMGAWGEDEEGNTTLTIIRGAPK